MTNNLPYQRKFVPVKFEPAPDSRHSTVVADIIELVTNTTPAIHADGHPGQGQDTLMFSNAMQIKPISIKNLLEEQIAGLIVDDIELDIHGIMTLTFHEDLSKPRYIAIAKKIIPRILYGILFIFLMYSAYFSISMNVAAWNKS